MADIQENATLPRWSSLTFCVLCPLRCCCRSLTVRTVAQVFLSLTLCVGLVCVGDVQVRYSALFQVNDFFH